MDFVTLDDYNTASMLFSKSQNDSVKDLELFVQQTLHNNIKFEIDQTSASLIMQAISTLNQKNEATIQLESDLIKIRQDSLIKEKRFEQIQQQLSKENKQLVLDQLQVRNDFRNLQAQFNQTEEQLKKQIRVYDDVVSKLDISEHAKRRLIQEIDQLKKNIDKLLKSKDKNNLDISTKTYQSSSLLEKKIRDLYFDIYQINLEKPSNIALNDAILAEAIAHVKKTYNEDMESLSSENNLLRQKLGLE